MKSRSEWWREFCAMSASGGCRLILGDARRVLPDLPPPAAIVTDPPYGMAFKSGRRSKATAHRGLCGDGDGALLSWACSLTPAHSSYVWMRWGNLRDVPMPKSLITWVKNVHSMGDLNHEHARQTEVCAFYPGPDHHFPAGRPVDVVRAPRTGNTHHPTEKPVGLMALCIGWTAGLVCDPFMGSGTTLVACAQAGRAGVGIEIDPQYFDIACARVEAALRQPDMFAAPAAAPVQSGFI